MARNFKGLTVQGLILISPGLDMSATSGGRAGNDLPYILEFPSLAVAAWEHEKVARAGRKVEAVFNEAAEFAQTELAIGLFKGATLSYEERHRLAQGEAYFIGLPASAIELANLRIDSQTFLEKLMGEGKIVGRTDTRVVADVPKTPVNPDRPAAANDPALNLGASNVRKSPAIKRYFEDELKVSTARDYVSLSLDVNFRWNWSELIYDPDPMDPSFYVNPTGYIATAMRTQPQLQLLLVGGYYDLAVPLLAPRYALAHAGVPLERVRMMAMSGPHSTFEGKANRIEGTSAVRAFMLENALRPHH
jgi:carboxypeptidase C (cathepsin A)